MAEYSIFTKMCIVDKKGKELEIIERENEYGYLLKSESKYTVKISYYIHEYNKNPMTKIHVSIEDSRNLCGAITKEMEINNKNSKHSCLLEIKPIDNSQCTSIGIKCREEKIEEKDIVHVIKSLNIFVDSKINMIQRRILVIVCLLAMGVSTWISTLPVERIIKEAEERMNLGKTLGIFKWLLYEFSVILDDGKYFLILFVVQFLLYLHFD